MMAQTALITGASSGIGKALVSLLLEKGYRLIVSGRNEAALQEFQEKAQVIVADLSTKEGVATLQKAIQQEIPDLIINCAGLGFFGPSTLLQADEMIDVNVKAAVTLTLTARDTWQAAKKGGTIMNVSSVLAFFPTPQMSVYAASKAFLSSFSEALDFELRESGIRVLTACPGQVMSDFRKRAGGKREAQQTFFAMSRDEAALAIWRQIERGESCKIMNWKSYLLYWCARLLPKKMLMSLVSRDIKNR
jgi:uncharacterized protein